MATRRRAWIVLVGGFLGSGKTTLITAAARELRERGLSSAAILNDQGGTLVDSQYAAFNNLQSTEVAGGCFCCKYSDLTSAIETLNQDSPDVIFAEPVGSCTDISATILHPLYELTNSYRIAPYTVLVDPKRAETMLHKDANASLKFLFWKQLQEADLVCLTKMDLEQELPKFGEFNARAISAKTGQGVAAWLDEVLFGGLSAGTKVLDIDYEQYASAEAALAWLNVQVAIGLERPLSPAIILGSFLDQLDARLTKAGVQIVHLKAIIRSESGFLKAALCGNGEEPVVEGALDASPAAKHELLLNLRAVGEAPIVKQITMDVLEATRMQMADLTIACFHPSAPKPERRVQRVG